MIRSFTPEIANICNLIPSDVGRPLTDIVGRLTYRRPDSTIDGSLITFVDVTSIVQAEHHQRLLVDELNHRAKDMLTVVISLATKTLRRSTSPQVFRDVFLGRIHALIAAYTLLSRDGWSPISLREVLTEELRPFTSPDTVTASLAKLVVLLQPRAALAVGRWCTR